MEGGQKVDQESFEFSLWSCQRCENARNREKRLRWMTVFPVVDFGLHVSVW